MSTEVLQENIGVHLCQLRPGRGLFEMTSKARGTEGKDTIWTSNGKLLHIKGHEKVKRQLTEWENIFANCISDKGLVSGIYK